MASHSLLLSSPTDPFKLLAVLVPCWAPGDLRGGAGWAARTRSVSGPRIGLGEVSPGTTPAQECLRKEAMGDAARAGLGKTPECHCSQGPILQVWRLRPREAQRQAEKRELQESIVMFRHAGSE